MILNLTTASTPGKKRVLALFLSVIMLLFFTHMGISSPYTWICKVVNYYSVDFDGHPANGDTRKNEAIVNYFYEPSEPDFNKMENIDIPLYYFLTSTTIGLTRSYALSHYIVNIIFLFLLFAVFTNLLLGFQLSESQIILSGLTILSLPFFTHYIGQQMYYISETSINFLILILIIKMTYLNCKDSKIFGLLGGILLVNYDCYQYYFAVVIYLFFFYRINNMKIFFITSGIIYGIWRCFIEYFSTSGLNLISSNLLSKYIFPAWFDYFNHIDFIFPFLVSHTGLVFASKMILSYFYWPLIFFIIFYLIKLKPDLNTHKFGYLAVTISLMYFLVMTLIVPLEWEHNPRRVIPIIFPFSMAIVYIVKNLEPFKVAKKLLYALIVLSFLLSFSDTIFKTPVIHSLQTADCINADPKFPFEIAKRKLDLPNNPPLKTGHHCKAKYDSKYFNGFIITQAFCFIIVFLLFSTLYKYDLIKIRLTRIYTILYLMSLFLRFL